MKRIVTILCLLGALAIQPPAAHSTSSPNIPEHPRGQPRKDWGIIPEATSKAIALKRTKRHPSWNKKQPRRRKKK